MHSGRINVQSIPTNNVRLLLQCGADVNVMNAVRETPLYTLLTKLNLGDPLIVQLLYEACAHLDCINALGETLINTTVIMNENSVSNCRIFQRSI